MKYRDIAMTLYDAGFAPLPLKEGEKRPSVSGWSTVEIEKAQVQQWADNGHGTGGVGIRCSQDCAGLDIDIYDKKISNIFYNKLKLLLDDNAPLVRVGQEPKFLLPFSLTGDVSSVLRSGKYQDKDGNEIGQIEVFPSNKHQFVAYGVHPGTGKEYRWINGTLSDSDLFSLPSIDELDILALIDEFEEMAREKGWVPISNRTTQQKTPQIENDPFIDCQEPTADFDELKEAVYMLPKEYCDDREKWITVGMAIHFETGGAEKGLDLFLRWSQTSEKYKNSGDVMKRWESFKTRKEGEKLVTFRSLVHIVNENEQLDNDVTSVTSVTSVTPVTGGDNNVTNCVTTSDEMVTTSNAVAWKVKEFIDEHVADFTTMQIYQELGYNLGSAKTAVRTALWRMVKNEEIKKHPTKRGTYQVLQDDTEIMQPVFDDIVALDIELPLGLSNHVNVLPGSVIIVGGATNAGKTLFGFEFLKNIVTQMVENDVTSNNTSRINKNTPTDVYTPPHSLRSFVGGVPRSKQTKNQLVSFSGIRFLNSEMSPHELGFNLKGMGQKTCDLLNTNVEWIKRNCDYPRAILKDGINVLDFLQIHKDFYEIGGVVSEMADAIGDGVLLVLIQKKSGEAAPRGGDFALERARLAIMMDYAAPKISSAYIRKAKYPTNYEESPQGKELEFKITPDLLLEPVSNWRHMDKAERKATYAKYLEAAIKQESYDSFLEV